MAQPEIRAHARGTVIRPDQCCDMHNVHCEQGGDQCCGRCAEAHHFEIGHGGTRCVERDGNG